MTRKMTVEDGENFNALIDSVRTAEDFRKLMEQLIRWRQDGSFFWSNSDQLSFFIGMSDAAEIFHEAEHLKEITDCGPWRTLAEIIGMALVLD